jgi:FtsZ-binding cell division protein ZapB
MTTPNIEELIAVLEATNQFHENADICTADVIAALQSQAERINELETEAEQLRKGHFDTSEANAALRSKLKGITICTVKRAQKINIIKPWHERVALIAGVLAAHHIRDAMQTEIDELRAENTKLRAAAIAVIDRWDTPHWKDVPATAEYIGRLRAALGEKS